MKTFGIAGWSGSGKTTLLKRLVPALSAAGLTVATIKHTHHNPALGDVESRALAAAGATEVMAASSRRFAVMHELEHEADWPLDRFVDRVAGVDLVLVEGFKFNPHPKLEVWDPALGRPMLAPDQPSVLAIASDVEVPDCGRPLFRRDDVDGIARFILAWGGWSADVAGNAWLSRRPDVKHA